MFQGRVIAKAVSGCNLQCLYCSAGNHIERIIKVMGRPVLERMTQNVMSLDSDTIEFNWHGGEPLLASLDFYKDAVMFQNRFRRDGQTIINGLQSNVALLDNTWLDFFQEHEFLLGVSVDGPQDIHDRQRPYVGGGASFTDVMRGIRLLQKRGMHLNVIAVVTCLSADRAKDIFDFFIANDITTFDFLACAGVNQTTGKLFEVSVSPVAYAQFMSEIFDLWVERGDPTIRIRHLENILDGIQGGEPSLCNFTGGCNSMVTVDYNGDVYPCDFFLDYEEFRFGNILENPLVEILAGQKRNNFLGTVFTVSEECKSCEWFPICHGDCAHRRYMLGRNFGHRSFYCSARKALFKHVKTVVEEFETGSY